MLKKVTLLLLCFSMVFVGNVNAQKKKKKQKEEAAKAAEAKAPEKPKKPDTPKKGPKPYKEVVDSTAKTSVGLHTVHKVGDKYYFEIPDSLLEREIIAVTRFSKTPAGGGVFGGEEVNRQIVKWEKGQNDNLLLRSVTVVMMSPDSTKPISMAVANSNVDPIIGNFDILAIKKDSSSKSSSYVVDITSTFDGDFQPFSLNPIRKQLLNITGFQKDKSFIENINSYPINTEIRSVKTFGTTPPKISLTPTPKIGANFPAGYSAGLVTIEFNTSLLLLPKTPMRRRAIDPRVGFFANSFDVYGEDSQKSDEEVFAVRWMLEPKNAADIEKMKRGELVEPKNPIVYYIDPATPDKWKKYIKAGIDDWQPAFEAAGWKNAIRGEYWPENDSTMSLEDARYSVVRYFAADIKNAYGPNVHDPRSGQILESHIGWYHNIMSLLRDWYLIQTAAVDPAARYKTFDADLMGELVRFVSSHEVGHTLGLRHNMGASSATPVEKLRDPEFQAKNGHTSSIMDYARFNYVAQPGDGVKHLFPRIGDYDKWAIKWGYSYFPEANSAKEEKAILHKLTTEAVKNPRLRFGTEISPYDPRYQTEDIGDNAMKASEYGILNLQRILPQLTEWSKEEGETYMELDGLYNNLVGQFRRYMGHVIKYVGGVYDTPVTYDTGESQFEIVPKNLQKDAITFLNAQLFKTPEWIISQEVLNKINPENGVEAVKAMQSSALSSLLAGDRAVRLMEASSLGSQYYSLDDLYSELQNGIFSELKSGGKIDIFRRNLQKVFVENLIRNLKPGKASVRSIPVKGGYASSMRTVELSQTDLPSVARGTLLALKAQLNPARFSDKLSKYHVQDLAARIDAALNPK